MERIGTDYGGWYIHTNSNLNSDSIIYSVGVGEDISFDLLMSEKYKSNIYLIDPTIRAIKHVDVMRSFYKDNSELPENISNEYKSIIVNAKPDIEKMFYVPYGLWDSTTKLPFFEPVNKKYVSCTVIPKMYSEDFYLVDVTSVKELMKMYNHTKIDMIKLDIEGAEIEVVNKMLDDQIYPTYLLIEFDLFLKHKDPQNRTKTLINRILECGYSVLKNDNMNITFYQYL